MFMVGTLVIIEHQFTSNLAYKFHVFLVKVSWFWVKIYTMIR